MQNNKYKVGKNLLSWKSGEAQTITFIVTEDCNLRCKYCYITHKSTNKSLNIDTAKKFIDYILSGAIITQDAVIIDFIGGEPLIEMDLIDEITDYFKLRTFELDLEWYWNYRINICTNGINYSTDKVQKFIKKNNGKISLAISIDGTKEKHDLQRVTIEGNGSYDIIMKNVPLWLSQFVGSTKITFASKDLKYLKDSIISLWNKGITEVASNVVFENVWKEGDDKILENQLRDLADYVIDNHLFNMYYCTFFDDTIGYYYDDEDMNRTYCGAGKMIALGPNGNLYPCLRFKDFSLNNQEEWTIGDVEHGINMDKIRPFILSTTKFQSESKCLNCPIASGCAFCQGYNYDESEIGTNFHRATYICEMHKARVRANDYYFSKLFNMYGIRKDYTSTHKRNKLYILMSNSYITYCNYDNETHSSSVIMNDELIKNSLSYARNNFCDIILVHSKNTLPEYKKMYDDYHILHYLPILMHNKICRNNFRDCKFIVNENDIGYIKNNLENLDNQNLKLIVNISACNINNFSYIVKTLLMISDEIEINITHLSTDFDFDSYKNELNIIKNALVSYRGISKIKKVDLIKDEFDNSPNGCNAGEKEFVISPDGKIYPCCGSYSTNSDLISNSMSYNLKKIKLYTLESAPLCSDCEIHNCKRCAFINKQTTNEKNIPPSFICKKSIIEHNISVDYQNLIKDDNEDLSSQITYSDSIEKWIRDHKALTGYYKY